MSGAAASASDELRFMPSKRWMTSGTESGGGSATDDATECRSGVRHWTRLFDCHTAAERAPPKKHARPSTSRIDAPKRASIVPPVIGPLPGLRAGSGGTGSYRYIVAGR